jgi:hypothetical protein
VVSQTVSHAVTYCHKHFVKPPSDTLLPYFNMFHLAPSPSSLKFTELNLLSLSVQKLLNKDLQHVFLFDVLSCPLLVHPASLSFRDNNGLKEDPFYFCTLAGMQGRPSYPSAAYPAESAPGGKYLFNISSRTPPVRIVASPL